MSGDDPVQILVEELTNSSYGQLGSLQKKLKISSSELAIEPLSRLVLLVTFRCLLTEKG